MSLLAFTFMAFSSMFVIVDPIASIPAFLAMTARDTPEQRIKMARLACLVAAAVLLVFALIGKWIFQYLGITLPAFQMAASLVLLLVSLDMIRAQRSRVQETSEETIAGTEKEDIAITPLAIPMLAGPGAISTAILLHNQATGWEQNVALYLCIVAVCFGSYHILRLSAHGVQWLSPIALKITIRIMGLLLAAMAFQFLINAVAALRKAG
ncbi:MAG: NAAT family transporter [Proteobacteria bacterium]|jgi:multiple antibiotic resistance protein|nr:NAAT family transporter [Pseudomonadota bacterium]NDF01530.1 NAAT family transporter [Verrucomicrobiota bacterium]